MTLFAFEGFICVMHRLVRFQISDSSKFFVTFSTFIWLVSRMYNRMALQRLGGHKLLLAHIALEGFDAHVGVGMRLQVRRRRKRFGALRTLESTLIRVRQHVSFKRGKLGKGFIAFGTDKGFIARMASHVLSQSRRSSKLFGT